MNLTAYMEQGIDDIAINISRFYLKSKLGRKFIMSFAKSLPQKAKLREHNAVPPFLIASIAAECNLSCAGCYAMATCRPDGDELTADEWATVFGEADTLGVSFILLAGGEPLLRRDVIDAAIDFPNIVFPVFTNGTLIDDDYINLFDKYRNIIPVLSIEGGIADTDTRRGVGISEQLISVAAKLKAKNILFGVSITVTNQNMDTVSNNEYIKALHSAGCGIVFFIEYVPAEKGTENLVLSENEIISLDERVKKLRTVYKNMSFVSFPGDEKYMGGCLAAGRGFFHINAYGGAEPCPFSPFSDVNVKNGGLLTALKSPLFQKLRDTGILAGEHKGACLLFEKEEDVKALLNK